MGAKEEKDGFRKLAYQDDVDKADEELRKRIEKLEKKVYSDKERG